METTRSDRPIEVPAETAGAELTMAQFQQMNIHGLQLRVDKLHTDMGLALEELSDEDKRILPKLENDARKAELVHQKASKSALTGDEKDDRDISARNAAKALHALGEFIRGDEKRLVAFQTRQPLRRQLEISKSRIAHMQAMKNGKSQQR